MTGSLCDVLPTAAGMLSSGACAQVAVVLVDGMGFHLLERMAPHAPLLASVLGSGTGRLEQWSCTFPSTTPTSLVSLGTGVAPGRHGVLGFTVLVPGTERVLTHIMWRDDPPPDLWQPVPTCFERFAREGLESAVVLPELFRGSGLTSAAYRGARFCGLAAADDPAERMVAELRSGTRLVYGYTAVLDTAAHVHGIASPQWAEAAGQVDAMLTRIVEGLPPGAALVVTADHGGLDVPADGRVDLDTDPALSAGVRAVAGEPRLRYLHTFEGATPDVLAAWRSVLGARADVLDREDAIGRGLFGSVEGNHRQRIGNVVVICRDDAVVLASAHEPPEVSALVGFHGALNPEETAVPLITFTAD